MLRQLVTTIPRARDDGAPANNHDRDCVATRSAKKRSQEAPESNPGKRQGAVHLG